MHNKLATLFHLLTDAQVKGEDFSFGTAAQNPKVTVLINEILATFGLPPTAEHIEILIGFGRVEDCSDAVIDDTLVRLADAGAFHLTMEKLQQ
jgi:hypothetical protein